MPPTDASFVTCNDVTRRFGLTTAVADLSFAIEPGETVALLGPNGAGKTTTIELLLGLRRPDAGVVRLFGGSPSEAIARGRVGAMLQDAGLPPGATVTDLVATIAALYPTPLPTDEAVRLCDLAGVAGQQVQRLSGGQRQRVRLALALAGQPELLVLDEPTAALDVEARRVFWDRARASASEGRALLFATHRLEEADTVADRVLIISDGRLLADGTPAAVRASVDSRTVVSFTLGDRPIEHAQGEVEQLPGVTAIGVEGGRVVLYTTDPDRTVRALLTQLPEAENLEVTRTGLEEAFIELTSGKVTHEN